MESNLSELAQTIPAAGAAIFAPESIAGAIDLDPAKWNDPDWRETAAHLRAEFSPRFFKGDGPTIAQEISAGKLIDPSAEVAEIADLLTAQLCNTGISRRRRRIDGDDGEINITRFLDDRDDRLFTRRRRTPQPAPVVNLFCSFAHNCGQNLKRFAESAAAVCAVTQVLESCGLSVNAYGYYGGRNTRQQTRKIYAVVRIKTAGTPVNISQIWTYTRPEVSRRFYFMLYCKIGDHFNQQNDPNIAYPENLSNTEIVNIAGPGKHIHVTNDVIYSTKGNPAALADYLQRLIDAAFSTTTQEQE